ncbi:uncharacterized protein GIQ15_03677 [Arthroderma uncinatum]|uniref:uncharacterized protein n=1 Tax=Arthroderma uncinatum TaxID=74035 RepID=UPI00144A741F|nr:uncharacterized protein GIQ15_03677 [Arthroderma uncinatum]KAF3484353.1 hypothetical protein GIQ15_03677 [Arthroderma uncinatum]
MRLQLIAASTALSFPYKQRILVSRCIGRKLSSAAAPYLHENVVNVPVGSSGNITLSILSPIDESVSCPSNVIIYLPPGSLFERPQYRKRHGSSTSHGANGTERGPSSLLPQENLAITTLSTTVTIKYRLGRVRVDGKQKSYRYPTPVHDTLAGFDWAMNEFQPDNIFVFGRHIGGSLALMLALTESRRLKAVAAEDPVCDWVGLDDYCITDIDTDGNHTFKDDAEEPNIEHDTSVGDANANGRKRGRKKKDPPPTPSDLVPLLEARRRFFPTPEKYFDAFSSPTLFLRTSGKYIPLTFPPYFTGPGYPTPILKRQPKTEADALYMTDLLSSAPPPSPSSTIADNNGKTEENEPPLTSLIKPVRRRKVLSRWPPSGLDYGLEAYESQNRWVKREETVLPDVRIFVHDRDIEAIGQKENCDDVTSSVEEKEGDDLSAQMQAINLDECHTEHQHTSQRPQSGRGPQSSSRFRGSLRNIGRISGDTVLARQGKEIVSLMRNACFWGREKGAAERCVKLVPILPPNEHQTSDATGTAADQAVDIVGDANSISRKPDPVEVQAGQHFLDLLGKDQSG